MSSASMKLVKCKIELVTAELSKLLMPTDGTLRQVVDRLADYYEKNEAEIELADCTTCGGGSDVDLDACPFCGTGGPVDDQAAQQAAQQAESEPELVDASLREDDPEDEPEPEGTGEEGEAEVSKSSKKKATKAVKAPATKSKPAAREAKAAPAPDPEEAHEAEIVDGVPTSTALVSTAELDAQVKIIRTTSAEGGVLYWRLGQALNKISDEGLWKLRIGVDSVPKFKSFKQFCTDELGSSPQHIYRAMNVAKHLTEEQVRGLSANQVRVVMQLPAGDQRDEILADAKQGKGRSKLTQKADALRGVPSKAKADEAPEDKRQVTVAVVQGQHKLKMYKRPTTGGARVGDTTDAVRAKKLGDNPWAVLDLGTPRSPMRLLIRVQPNPTGELVCVVEFRRGVSVI